MSETRITTALMEVQIEELLVLDGTQSIEQYYIRTLDNNHATDSDLANNIEVDIFGKDALLVFADALNIYIEHFGLRKNRQT